MKATIRLLLATILAMMVLAPATAALARGASDDPRSVAQGSDSDGSTTGTPAAGSPLTMTVSVGLDGYVDPSRPGIVDVEFSASSLVVGTLEVTVGSTSKLAVEVPAGGVKSYTLETAPPQRRRQVVVKVVDADDVVLAEETVRLRTVSEGLLVGVLGADELETALRSATSTPTGAAITTVALDPDRIDGRIAPLNYLVAGPGTIAGLDEAATRSLRGWVQSGGRIYAPRTDTDVLAESAGGTTLVGAPITVRRIGTGEVGVLEDGGALTVEEWSAVLRDRPNEATIVDQSSSVDPGFALVSAASAGQEATVPALPWLLAGILVFVLLVGPVNFFVLRSMGRPDWAWVSVPLLSIVFLGVFWGIGRSQLVDFTVSHGTVVLDDGIDVKADSGLLVQVEGAGEHTLDIGSAGTLLAPGSSIGGGIESGTLVDGSIVFDLDDLGLGTAEARWGGQQVPLSTATTVSDEGIVFSVTNDSDRIMWAWGVIVNGLGTNGDGTLAPGETKTVVASGNRFTATYDPVVAEAVARRPFKADEVRPGYEVVYPLASFAEGVAPSLRRAGAYVFGLTEDGTFSVDVDGRTGLATGTTLYVGATDIDQEALVALGSVKPEVLSVVGASSSERYGDDIYVYGAEEVYLLYAIPDGAPTTASLGGSNPFDVAEVYDWSTGEFRIVDWNQVLATSASVSAGGEVVLRLSNADDEDFFDQTLSLSRLAMRWGEA